MFYPIFLFFLSFFPKTNSYVDYHHSTIQAEIAITEGNYKQALRIYKKTFSNYPNTFHFDLNNALVCAIRLNKKKEMFVYAVKLLQKGLPLEYLSTNYPNLVKEVVLWNELRQEYEANHLAWLEQFDTEMMDGWIAMTKEEQRIRFKGTGNDNLDSILYIDSVNFILLNEMIQRHGTFPDENIVGLRRDSKENKIVEPGYWLVIRHLLYQKKYATVFLPKFRQAIIDGNMEPELLAFARVDHYGLDDFDNMECIWKGSNEFFLLSNDRYKTKPYKSLAAEVEDLDDLVANNRLKWGLPSVEEQVILCQFKYGKADPAFKIYLRVSSADGSKEFLFKVFGEKNLSKIVMP